MARNSYSKSIVVCTITFIFLLSILIYLRLNSLIRSEAMVNNSTQLTLELEKAMGSLRDVELAKLKFQNTRDSAYLAAYQKKLQEYTSYIHTIKQLIPVESFQLNTRNSNPPPAEPQITNLDTTLFDLCKDPEMPSKFLLENTDSIGLKIAEMIRLEENSMTKLKQEFQVKYETTPVLIIGLSLGFILILLVLNYNLNQSLSNARKLETELVGQKNELEKSEFKFNRMFNLCPVSLSLAESSSGKIIMVNDQFLKTFKFSKDEVIGRSAVDLNIISDEDRNRMLEEISRNDSTKTREIEMFDKSGVSVPVIISVEKIEIGGQPYFLGSYIGIQERKMAELNITRANEDLKKINEELYSFTYICSHDLQEPLRKIQTFISLLKDKDYQALSEDGKHYIERIQNSANRMQLLINDLLTYSRTEITNKNFDWVDLSDLVKEVQYDLKEEINNKKASIELIGDGKIKVIPFQFRQLMINILSNSLKFSDDGRPLYIVIKYELIEHPEFERDPNISNEIFHKITISDNGIGFDQSYSKKIFTIFQRLHSRSEYEGTGIGLAIVKKIINNHSGYIFAYGELGSGALFEIYLPA